MQFTSPTQPPANSQYDADSAPNQNVNCGPTTVTNVLRFHMDEDFPIEETRNLATKRNGTGTNTSERKLMLDRRGIRSSVRKLSPSQVKALLNGKRAFDMALLMGKIPLAIRQRPFAGSHSVEVVAKGVKNGVPGIWVNNPDFSRARGPKYQPARYFYPDKYWIPAFRALGSYCVVPDHDKVIKTRTAYVRKLATTAGLNARSGPSVKHTIVKVVPAGYAFTSIQREIAGGVYVANGKTRHDWVSFNLGGRLVWVAQGYTKGV